VDVLSVISPKAPLPQRAVAEPRESGVFERPCRALLPIFEERRHDKLRGTLADAAAGLGIPIVRKQSKAARRNQRVMVRFAGLLGSTRVARVRR
jgi:hypothetical protein